MFKSDLNFFFSRIFLIKFIIGVYASNAVIRQSEY